MIRISGIVNDSIVDGPGLRLTIFTQGCPHRCEGCHNPETHDYKGGYDITIDEIVEKIDKNPLLDGITLSGGEPFEQAEELSKLAGIVKGRGLNVVAYSGYTWEYLNSEEASKDKKNLLKHCDILVDGKFEQDKKSLLLLFRGSSNQRLIDVAKSYENGSVVLIQED